VQPAQTRGVRHRLDIERKNRRHSLARWTPSVGKNAGR
jgi:hypothetical protein